MSRSVKEWIGKNDDSKAPPRVRQRVFDKYEGKCYISGLPIGQKPWQLDHVVALINGGENRESNLAPILTSLHKKKTAQDVRQKAKTAKIRGKHTGAIQPKGKIQSRGFAKGTKGKRLTHPDFLIK